MNQCRLLLFDLDGTLLRSDKTISQRTLKTLQECRDKGILIGVSTSRSEQNALSFIKELQPDVLIVSGGALVKYKGEYIYKAEFSGKETRQMIAASREICEADFENFNESSLKMCVEIFDEHQAERLRKVLQDCDCIRFSDGYWYKFTKKTATKERAILEISVACGISTEQMAAFGDDYADMGMLTLCGQGIAMGNAIDEVRAKADMIIGSNDEDGIAEYLENEFLLGGNCKAERGI